MTAAVPLQAQYFGQWSWQGEAGIQERLYENTVSGANAGRYDERDVHLGLGVNGFIVHPAIAAFHLGIDALVSRFTGVAAADSRMLGWRGELSLFPSGIAPARVYTSRQMYSYAADGEASPYSYAALPDQVTRVGARVRVRGGALRGLLVGVDARRTTFLQGVRAERADESFADWSGGSEKLMQHYRLENRSTDYGAVNFSTDDTTATAEEHGWLAAWRWDMSGLGMRRTLRTGSAPAMLIDSLSLANRFVRRTASGNQIELYLSDGLLRFGGTSQSHSLSGRYLWQVSQTVALTPTATVNVQQSGPETVRAPSAGLGATWTPHLRGVELVADGSAAYGRLTASGTRIPDSSFVAIGAGVSAAHGAEQTLREELQLSWASNQVRQAGDTIAPLPDLGGSLAGLGTQDVSSGRVTLRRRWGEVHLYAYSDWSRRQTKGGLLAQRYDVTTLYHTLTVESSHGALMVNLGRTDVRSAVAQDVRFESVSLSLPVSWWISLRGTYRRDQRDLTVGPSVRGERTDLSLSARFGAYVVQGTAFSATDRLPGAPGRTNRGVQWTLSRRFGGLLPIVSAPLRRGVVR